MSDSRDPGVQAGIQVGQGHRCPGLAQGVQAPGVLDGGWDTGPTRLTTETVGPRRLGLGQAWDPGVWTVLTPAPHSGLVIAMALSLLFLLLLRFVAGILVWLLIIGVLGLGAYGTGGGACELWGGAFEPGGVGLGMGRACEPGVGGAM